MKNQLYIIRNNRQRLVYISGYACPSILTLRIRRVIQLCNFLRKRSSDDSRETILVFITPSATDAPFGGDPIGLSKRSSAAES